MKVYWFESIRSGTFEFMNSRIGSTVIQARRPEPVMSLMSKLSTPWVNSAVMCIMLQTFFSMLATFFSHSLKPPLNSVKVRTSSITRPRTFKHTTCASRLLSFLPKYLSFIHKMTTFSSAAASASSTTFLSDNAIPITVGINGKDYDQLIDSVGTWQFFL